MKLLEPIAVACRTVNCAKATDDTQAGGLDWRRQPFGLKTVSHTHVLNRGPAGVVSPLDRL